MMRIEGRLGRGEEESAREVKWSKSRVMMNWVGGSNTQLRSLFLLRAPQARAPFRTLIAQKERFEYKELLPCFP